MRSAVLTAASLGMTAMVLGNAWFQRQQFYPSVVYITKSNPSMAVIYLQSLVMVILMGKLMRKIFFGQLRAAEFEHLMERSWYAVTETCLAFTVFKDDFSPKFVALFTLLLFLKSFHWLAEDRVDYMERSPVITVLFHLRVLSLALVLASLDLFFIQHAYTSTLTKGASVQLVFGFEYAILLTIVINTLVKYVLHSIDLHSENPWENKAVFMLYTELFIGFIKVLLYILFFVIMVRIYTLPLFAVRPMYLTMRAFKKAFNDVVLSRRAIHNMNTLYPDATAEELADTDNVCIICREEMVAPSTKKLPCNHIFHRNCLRSWFQRQQTCPTCRLDVLRAPGVGGGAGGQQQQPGQAVFQQQMAALRNQLEAMQAQRQQPGVAGQPNQNQAMPNFLNMMGQMGGMPPFAGMPGGFVPPGGAAAPQQQQAGAPVAGAGATAGAAAAAVGAATGAAGAAPAAGGVRPPFMFPPFPFLPFTVPPPQPPPNFSGMSDTELQEMEGRERTSVEARIRCLRNIQVLLDAAVMEMQQYSAVVARANTTAAPGVAPGTDAAATAASNTPDDASSAADTGLSEETDTATSSASTSGVSSSSTPTTSTISSVSSTATSSASAVVPPELLRPLLSPSETGARPKVPTNTSVAPKAESVEEKSGEEKGEKPKENPFDALSEEPATRTAEQEEIRKRRLAVFEEQKKRLMNK
eukprot:TRINITY_DN46002_c0_g1_i1.p1 TRINITY_DN46002_c0_g1~~TRINITY_DN46002_c0_g1_i1.p1  ORF type:complete len:696 (-),score=248.20 TRINITY_DN46002_c0_g1_i1:163-2250(-)